MISQPAADLFSRACRWPLLAGSARTLGPMLDRAAVEGLLPHRDPFLFVDRISRLDPENGIVVARYAVPRDAWLQAGHFPGRPVWPGALQVEAIGQAGLCLARLGHRDAAARRFALTHILAAQFRAPVEPGEVEIAACIVSDGLFTIIVGQCLQDNRVCSAAAVRGIEKEIDDDPCADVRGGEEPHSVDRGGRRRARDHGADQHA